MSQSILAEPLDQHQIAAALREIASYLRLSGDVYRAKAYDRAGNSVEEAVDFDRVVAEKRLTGLGGIGKSLEGVIVELRHHGSIALLDELRGKFPAGIVEMGRLPGLSDKKARELAAALNISSVAELAEACRQGRVRGLPGYGEKSEAKLLAAAEKGPPEPLPSVVLLSDARHAAETLLAHLAASPAVKAAEAAGDLRRCKEIIERLDLVVASDDPEAVRAHLSKHPQVLAIEGNSLKLSTGMPAALHVVPPASFGVALVWASSDPAHFAQLAGRAGEQGVDLMAIPARDEAAVYAALSFPFVPAEVRDGEDELDGKLNLITRADLRGAVHSHTTYSDGKHSVLEMALAAEKLGFEYLTITDHSAAASYAGGLTIDRIKIQWDEIDRVQEQVKIRLLKGTESDILADGALDWPDHILEKLDVVIASVHQRHKLDENAATDRIRRCFEWPVFKIWGHPLGRMLGRREPFACRLDELFEVAARSRVAFEINGDPHRLDMAPDLVKKARQHGLRFVLSCDAHHTSELKYTDYAVAMARRARLSPTDVLNTLPVDDFRAAVAP